MAEKKKKAAGGKKEGSAPTKAVATKKSATKNGKALNKKKMEYLDVRRGRDTKGTRSANLMCFLLQGLRYEDLYVKPFNNLETLRTLETNARNLPKDLWVDAEGNEAEYIRDAFLKDGSSDPSHDGAFIRLKRLLEQYPASQPPIRLHELFWKTLGSGTDPATYDGACKKIVEILDSVHGFERNDYSHFCVPFVGIQKGHAAPCKEFQMLEFLHFFRSKNIKYFYTVIGSDDEKEAIRRAKKAGILSEVRNNHRAGSGNGMHCSNNVCVACDNEEHFCNMVEDSQGNMHCSLYSDQG